MAVVVVHQHLLSQKGGLVGQVFIPVIAVQGIQAVPVLQALYPVIRVVGVIRKKSAVVPYLTDLVPQVVMVLCDLPRHILPKKNLTRIIMIILNRFSIPKVLIWNHNKK